ncbi:hypothetical protein Franean1_0387 [Parafrankia sp. EAN1pec]|nr:hypothetical protein Franean1_0387 [Frankia sp. EAN1pec]
MFDLSCSCMVHTDDEPDTIRNIAIIKPIHTNRSPPALRAESGRRRRLEPARPTPRARGAPLRAAARRPAPAPVHAQNRYPPVTWPDGPRSAGNRRHGLAGTHSARPPGDAGGRFEDDVDDGCRRNDQPDCVCSLSRHGTFAMM